MSKEQEQPTPQLNLEMVAQAAQERLLELGSHVPTLIVEGQGHAGVIEFLELADTHEDRVSQLFSAGFQVAQQSDMRLPRQIFFVTEGWMKYLEKDEHPELPPSQDPNRKEALVVFHWNAYGRQTQAVFFEMVRDKNQKLVEIRQQEADASPDYDRVESPLVTAFVQGFLTARIRPQA